MRRRMRICLAVWLVQFVAPGWLLASPPVTQETEPAAEQTPIQGLDEFIAETMKDWKVPGLAIAVVKDGKVIHSQGYGYRNVEKQLPVTPQTLFAIGSVTKSFVATGLGMLADDGKLEWDKPVRKYLPDFQLHNGVATEQMTPRDLVTHRSGLPRHRPHQYLAL